jgi:predicted RNA binding protein YcfA (HicA-like mRNA interferase family)
MYVLGTVPMKVRDAIKLIESDGWYLVGHPSRDLHTKTQASIMRQAGIRIQ